MNPEAEAYSTLAGAVAQEESRIMSENMQWTAIINFEQGIFANYKDILRKKECDRVYDEDVVRKKDETC